MTAQELQTRTFQGPGASNTTIKDPKREKEERKLWREREKKRPPTLRGSTLRGPTICRPKIQHLKIGRNRIGRCQNWPKSKLAEVEKKSWFKLAEVDLARRKDARPVPVAFN